MYVNTWSELPGWGEFPKTWDEILQHRVPIYGLLSEADRCELRRYIQWFLASKEFEGCGGLVITDEVRVTVAAQACLLLLHRETPCYQNLRLIRIYPGAHFARNSAETLAGESWEHGVVWLGIRRKAALRIRVTATTSFCMNSLTNSTRRMVKLMESRC